MRHSVIMIIATFVLAGPALADPPGDDGSTVKKVCRMIDTGNPLFPVRKCRTVVVDAPAKPSTTASDMTEPQPTQVAMKKGEKQPHY